jgi:cytoskeletal protein CcmA (bactofilin family)
VISLTDLRIVGSHPGKSLATCGDIRIEATARLQVAVIARRVTVLGRVRGPVNASESVEVGSTGHVIGDITAPKIIVQDGGVIQGNCTLIRGRPIPASIDIDGPVVAEAEAAARSGQEAGQCDPTPPDLPAVTDTPAPQAARPRPLARPTALRRPESQRNGK